MASLSRLMEKLADALPVTGKKSNESTATAAFYKGNGTLYFTHQHNKSYVDVLFGDRVAPSNYRGGIKKLQSHNFTTAFKNWLAEFGDRLPVDGDWRPAFSVFLDMLEGVKVVMNQDLFVESGVNTSGLHGESRIIRFLALKYLRLPEADLLSREFSPEACQTLESKFAEHFAEKLYFGSSQGACAYCGGYMNRLGIRWKTEQGINKDRDATWRNPFSMATITSTFGPPSKAIYAPTTADYRKQFKLEAIAQAEAHAQAEIYQAALREAQSGNTGF